MDPVIVYCGILLDQAGLIAGLGSNFSPGGSSDDLLVLVRCREGEGEGIVVCHPEKLETLYIHFGLSFISYFSQAPLGVDLRDSTRTQERMAQQITELARQGKNQAPWMSQLDAFKVANEQYAQQTLLDELNLQATNFTIAVINPILARVKLLDEGRLKPSTWQEIEAFFRS